MASRRCLAGMAGTALQLASRPRPLAAALLFPAPSWAGPGPRQQPQQQQVRTAMASSRKEQPKKKAKSKAYRVHNKAKLKTYSLCDALRYLRAAEVGRPPASVKFDLAVKLQTNKDGAVLRDRIRLPHPTSSDFRIAVICPEGSKTASDARQDGAVAVGEDALFAAIRAGDIAFNRLICHVDSVPALMKANLGPLLGPRGLMPSVKTRTVTTDVRAEMRELAGTANYRERAGVVRMAIGQLNFTPHMVSDNIKAFVAKLRLDMREIERQTPKAIDEVVLSSTHGPGISLSGAFAPTDSRITVADLATVM